MYCTSFKIREYDLGDKEKIKQVYSARQKKKEIKQERNGQKEAGG